MKDIEFGSFLYKLYHNSVKLESYRMKGDKECRSLTVNELNLIECIHTLTSGGMGPTISSIADELGITRPSTTVAVNKLAKKEMVSKTGSESDGRSVRVALTESGEKAYKAHISYQRALVKELKSRFSEDEYSTLITELEKIGTYFEEALDEESEKTVSHSPNTDQKKKTEKTRAESSGRKK